MWILADGSIEMTREGMMQVPTVKAVGVHTQRHLNALYGGRQLFSEETVHTAALSTGITVEYALHGTEAEAPAAASESQEDRIVMIMGFTERKESWGAGINMLLDKHKSGAQKKSLRILTLDNRGVGGSDVSWGRYTTSGMAQDVLALLDHVGWETAHVVGVSMGGMIALEIASAAPQRVRSLSLMVTTRGNYSGDHRGHQLMCRAVLSRDPSTIAENVMQMLYSEHSLTNPMEKSDATVGETLSAFHLQMIKQRAPSPSLIGIVGQLLAIQTHFVSDERLAEIRDAGFPILIMGGMKDILIPVVESITLYERLKAEHVKPLFFEDGGHGLGIQFVEEVADALVETFARSS